MSDSPVRYHVTLDDHVQHLVTVTVTVPAEIASGARVVLPTWTPGSYVVRDYVHGVQRVWASVDGVDVQVAADGHTAWRLPDDVDGDLELSLELYGNQLTVRSNHIDDRHALLIPPATFPYVEGAKERVHEVTIDPPSGWRVWGLLPTVALDEPSDAGETGGTGETEGDEGGDGDDAPTCFRAEDYDHLVDSAFEAGDHAEVAFTVAGAPHRFVWAGHAGSPDLDRVAEDTRRLCEAAVELFGELPTRDYTFLCTAWDVTGGGLEHRDGSVLMTPAVTFQDDERYARFQSLVTHEYLHLWNVKRMTPAALTHPDYERPTHTTSLWVAEGWTAYYDQLLPARSGVWPVRRFLETTRDDLHTAFTTPGRLLRSVQDASYHAWTGLYVRDENSPNLSPSYYCHGAVLALCLDLTIRDLAPDSDGLDTALRLLWQRFGTSRQTGGYTEADVLAAVNEAAGSDLTDFFAAHVSGREDPPVDGLLATVGLRRRVPDGDAVADLGAQTRVDDEGVVFTAVLRDGPAWRGGVTGGDRLIAIDGQRIGRDDLPIVLKAYAEGDVIHLAVSRGPRLLMLPVTLGAPNPRPDLVAVEEPTATQRTRFEAWTGSALPAQPATT